ncbi:MAG TPA: hypothetical protein VIJ12_10635 [Candidatus Baltobacteraceae bacterium]
MRRAPQIDIAAYGQGVVHFLKHLSILAGTLCAGAIALLLDYLGQTMTDPIGNVGAGIYSAVGQIVFLCAFGVAIVQANNVWRGRGGSFAQAWQESRGKLGNIALAAIGFTFVIWIAAYIGATLGLGPLSLVLQIIATFFLIYTIPAAAIGGVPGGMALSASIRAVRANPASAAVLTIVWLLLEQVPNLAALSLPSGEFANVLNVVVQAILFGYLAFPVAKQYDDVAFRAYW